MNHTQTLFRTSEFAKICGTTKRTLFYYDEINLLKPAFTDSMGARFYNPEQRMTYMTISSLKDLGMRLDEIADYMTRMRSEDFRQILENQKKIVQDRIENLRRIQTIIDTRLLLLDEEQKADPNTLSFLECPQEYYILSAPIEKDDPLLARSVLFDHLNECHVEHLGIGHPFAAMIDCEKIRQGITRIYSFYCTKLDHYMDHPRIHVKPAGLYAIAYLYGDYRKHHDFYMRMLASIHENGYECHGYSYKEGIVDEVSSANIGGYITRISIPVHPLTSR